MTTPTIAPPSPAPDFPAISIVVPNFNGGKTLAATLQSLIDQCYPKLEIIVMDGGSSDDSLSIIRGFERHIAYWQSARDRGQSDAINKGFARANGEIVNWLCSDDLLAPGALRIVVDALRDPAVGICIGKCQTLFPDRPDLNGFMWPTPNDIANLSRWNAVAQPSTFYRRSLLRRAPTIREDFYYAMDQELWCYLISNGATVKLLDAVLSIAVQDGRNKTRTADYRYYVETDRIFRLYGGKGTSPTPRWFRWSVRPLAIWLDRNPGPIVSALLTGAIHTVGGAKKCWRRVARRS